MSKMTEVKERVNRLAQLGKKMQEQVNRFKGPEGQRLKKEAKEQGVKIGIGAGMSVFGIIIAILAAVYSLAVVILLVNIALNRLWLSALIVVGGFLLIGVGIIIVGAMIAGKSAKALSKTTDDAKKEIVQIRDEMKTEVQEIQKLVKGNEAEKQQQGMEILETARMVAPVAAVALVGLLIVRRSVKKRKEKKRILKVIKAYDKSKK